MKNFLEKMQIYSEMCNALIIYLKKNKEKTIINKLVNSL